MKYRKQYTKVSVHAVSLRISTCKNLPRLYFTKLIYMTPSSSMHLDCNSFLAWQRIHFGDNPAGSKGFSCHSCHALQCKCNQGRSTRHGHSLSATCYIPHSPVNSHSSASLHSRHTCRQLRMFTQPRRFAHSVVLVLGSIYLLQQ